MLKLRLNTLLIRIKSLIIIFCISVFILGAEENSFAKGNDRMNEISNSTLSVSGYQVECLIVAYNDFIKGQKGIENYTVKLIDRGENVEIVFVPKQAQNSRPVLGGKTGLGREVHYLISKADKEIYKKHYSR